MMELWMKANNVRLMSDVGRAPLEGFASSACPSKAFSSVGAVGMEGTPQIPVPIRARISPIDVRKRVR